MSSLWVFARWFLRYCPIYITGFYLSHNFLTNFTFSSSASPVPLLDCVWNTMAHAQKKDFVFQRNGRVHLNQRGRQFSRLLAAEVCASAVVMLDASCYVLGRMVLATPPFGRFPFTSSPIRHGVPTQLNWTLLMFMLPNLIIIIIIIIIITTTIIITSPPQVPSKVHEFYNVSLWQAVEVLKLHSDLFLFYTNKGHKYNFYFITSVGYYTRSLLKLFIAFL